MAKNTAQKAEPVQLQESVIQPAEEELPDEQLGQVAGRCGSSLGTGTQSVTQS